jgi:hypothetical protein
MSVDKDVGAVRKRSVPPALKGASTEQILAWARGEMNGVEPILDRDAISKIRSGEVREVVLRPRKAGFFGPDGTFIEAYDYQPSIGEDLGDAEKRWAEEDEDRAWADAENARFNRGSVESSGSVAWAMWQHGKRISEYADKTGRPVWTMLGLLARRAGPSGYAKYTHQTCLYLFRWKPLLSPDDPICRWSWQLADAVLRFSRNNEERENAARAVRETSLGMLPAPQVAQLLGVRNKRIESRLREKDRELLRSFREDVSRGRMPTPERVAEVVAVIAQFRSLRSGKARSDGASRSEDSGPEL